MTEMFGLKQIETPKPLNPSGEPCAQCGNRYVHTLDCVQREVREPLPPGRTIRKERV